MLLHDFEMRVAFLAQMIQDRRQRVDIGLILRHLAIQHAQRIRHRAPLAIRAHVRRDRRQLFAQRRHERGPAISVTHRIDQQMEIRLAVRSRFRISTTISMTSASTIGESDPIASAPIWKNCR